MKNKTACAVQIIFTVCMKNKQHAVLDLQCTKNKTAVKDNESLFISYTAKTKRFFKRRYFNTNTFKMIPRVACMHVSNCIILSSESGRRQGQ